MFVLSSETRTIATGSGALRRTLFTTRRQTQEPLFIERDSAFTDINASFRLS
jgi:hypothetical protein